jgi:transposase
MKEKVGPTTEDAPQFRGCPIIKQLSDTFICFQLHITIMAFIKRLRNQNWLFHPTIADLIEEDHICRLVDAVVESIDFESIEGRYDGPGSPA